MVWMTSLPQQDTLCFPPTCTSLENIGRITETLMAQQQDAGIQSSPMLRSKHIRLEHKEHQIKERGHGTTALSIRAQLGECDELAGLNSVGSMLMSS